MFKKFKDFDSIPKERQSNALELKDGSYVVDEAEGESQLEKTLEKVRGERDGFERQLREEKTAHTETKRQLDVKGVTGADVDAKVAATLEKWQKEQATRDAEKQAAHDKEKATLNAELDKHLVDAKLTADFLAAGGKPEKVANMLRQAKHEWSRVDGKLVRKDADGNVMSTTSSEYFAKDYQTIEPEHYKGTEGDGGGAGGMNRPPAGSDKGGKPDKPITRWTPDERQAFKEANGGGAAGQKAYDDAMAQHVRESMQPPAPKAGQ
ncbi:MAG: hypothetical protein ACO1Q7_04065 [Gemmatimonas sp.]